MFRVRIFGPIFLRSIRVCVCDPVVIEKMLSLKILEMIFGEDIKSRIVCAQR